MTSAVELRVRFVVDDHALAQLHARAFGHPLGEVGAWRARLERHSLTWVGAFLGPDLIGFVNAAWDGGTHAFLLDAVVDPSHQKAGLGRALVKKLESEVAAAGCTWLHVDYEERLRGFYENSCGFRPTAAGLRRLDG